VTAKAKILDRDTLVERLDEHRAAGRRIVLTNGGFDLLHVGHIRALEAAQAMGEVLVVALNDDASVQLSKGPGRPLVPLAERLETVAALQCVDLVTSFGERTADVLLDVLRPDVYAKGRDYRIETLPERKTAERLGVAVAFVGDEKEHSSSDLVMRATRRTIPTDRVTALEDPDLKGFVLRSARERLGAGGWLDLATCVKSDAGSMVEGTDRRWVRRIYVSGATAYLKVTSPYERKRSPVLEFQSHLALRAAGFLAPEPWLCMEGHKDGFHAGVLITRAVEGVPLDAYLRERYDAWSAGERVAVAEGIGATVRALHTARFLHPDLQAWHLYVCGPLAAGRTSLAFIDLMRVSRAGRRLRQRDAAVGLAALSLSLRHIVPRRFRLAMLRGYLGGTLTAARPWIEAIERRIERIKDRSTFREIPGDVADEAEAR